MVTSTDEFTTISRITGKGWSMAEKDMAAELESVKTALQAARRDLEAARERELKLLEEIRKAGGGNSEFRRYAILIAIGLLAAWQVYLTIKLQGIMN
jgi:hypothetical protein